ncbi:hypothetical protein ACXYX3_17610 [Mycobacterium sp. C3-094]
MPARFSTSRGNEVDTFLGVETSASVSFTLNVNPLGNDRMLGLVAALLVTDVDTTGAAFTASFGGSTPLLKGSRTFDANQETMRLWLLEDIAGGPNTVSVNVASVPTELGKRTLHVIAAAFTGYEELGDLVQAGGSAATANTVTLTGGVEAGRFVSVHAVGKSGSITAVNRAKRAEAKSWLQGNLVLQDAAGGASVAMTATQTSTDDWGALGFPLTAAAIDIGADLSVGPVEFSTAGIGIYDRGVEPSPDRYWRLPADAREEVL